MSAIALFFTLLSCPVPSYPDSSCQVLSCDFLSCHFLSCHFLSWHLFSWHLLSFHFCPGISCPVISCPLSCLVHSWVSCPVLSFSHVPSYPHALSFLFYPPVLSCRHICLSFLSCYTPMSASCPQSSSVFLLFSYISSSPALDDSLLSAVLSWLHISFLHRIISPSSLSSLFSAVMS